LELKRRPFPESQSMDNDDKQVGRILTRREVLALLGVAGLGAVAARSGGQAIGERTGVVRLPACVVRPQQTEGPYFTDVKLNRGDIRSDPANGAVRDGVEGYAGVFDLGLQI
jgi:hypothetical protein